MPPVRRASTAGAGAAASGDHAPERIAALLREWRATAEAYADPGILSALTTPLVDCGPVPEPSGEPAARGARRPSCRRRRVRGPLRPEPSARARAVAACPDRVGCL